MKAVIKESSYDNIKWPVLMKHIKILGSWSEAIVLFDGPNSGIVLSCPNSDKCAPHVGYYSTNLNINDGHWVLFTGALELSND